MRWFLKAFSSLSRKTKVLLMAVMATLLYCVPAFATVDTDLATLSTNYSTYATSLITYTLAVITAVLSVAMIIFGAKLGWRLLKSFASRS